MTIKIPNEFREIEIKCKGLYEKDRCNRKDLIAFLNELAIVYHEASLYNMSKGWDCFAKKYQKLSDLFYDINKSIGAYNFD